MTFRKGGRERVLMETQMTFKKINEPLGIDRVIIVYDIVCLRWYQLSLSCKAIRVAPVERFFTVELLWKVLL